MLKWTSKGSLNSDDIVSSTMPHDLPWHKIRAVQDKSLRRNEPVSRPLPETAELRRLQNFVSTPNMPDGFKTKRSMVSEPSSPYCSSEDVRNVRSLSLPSSPQAKKKHKYGVFKKLKNIFRKGKSGEHFESPMLLHSKELYAMSENNSKKKKGVPKTRLTRLIETKRGQRKSRQSADEMKYTLGESMSVLSPSTSSDDEGNYEASLRNEPTYGHLASFAVPKVDGLAAKKTSASDKAVQRITRLGGVNATVATRIIEEPRVIARIIPGFHDEMDTSTSNPLHNRDEISARSPVSGKIDEDTPPVKVESFILDGNRYDFLRSPVQQQQQEVGSFNKCKLKFGSNGIRKSPKGRFEDNEENSSLSGISVSSTSVQELTRSLSFIKETGSMEKVKVIFSSPESIISARASLCPPNSDRRSPSSKSISNKSIRGATVDLHTDNDDPWSSQEEDQRTLLPPLDTGANDQFYKTTAETYNEYNHKIPLCTRNNNNGHHASPLVSSTTFCDSPPDANDAFFKPRNIFKSDPILESFSAVARKDLNYSENSFEMRPSSSPFRRKNAHMWSSPLRISDLSGSESDSKSSPLDINHQSLLTIRPKKVKEIVDQIEKESFNGVPRFSPIENVAEKQLKGADIAKPSENNKIPVEEKVQDLTQDKFRATIDGSQNPSSNISSDTEPDAEKEYSVEDNFSFTLDEDTYSKSDASSKRDAAEQDLTSPESSSFHMSDQMADDPNTYISDTNAFCSDNSGVFTSSAYSNEVENNQEETRFAPVVHLVCDTLMNSVCIDSKSESDYQREGKTVGRVVSVTMTQSATTDPVPKRPSCHDSKDNDELKEFENSAYDAEMISDIEDNESKDAEEYQRELSESSRPGEIDIPECTQEAIVDQCESVSMKDENFKATVHEYDQLVLEDIRSDHEEGITDVIAPNMMVILDASTSENVTETTGNKSIISDNKENSLGSNLESEYVGDQATASSLSLVKNEAQMTSNEIPGVNESIFYMPECALEEFTNVTRVTEIAKELKSKKKVSFKLETISPEESSVSDDRAVLETTVQQRQCQAQFSLGQASLSEVRESASSTDVSVTELSARSNDIQDMPTPTSGDDFSWWGAEKVDDIDFFHDQSFGVDQVQEQPQDTNVAPSSATENLLHEKLLSTGLGQQEDLVDLAEDDMGATSNVLTLSSFLTSGSIFNMSEQERQSLFLCADERQHSKQQEAHNDNSQATFDDRSWLHSDACAGDKSVNKQSETAEENPIQEYDVETVDNETTDSAEDHSNEDEAESQRDIDLTSDINTHTYNVSQAEIAREKEDQAWWEEHSVTSPTNYSLGSFQIDSQDESNTLSELYNQLKNSKQSFNQTFKSAKISFKKNKKTHVKPATEKEQKQSKCMLRQKVIQTKKSIISKAKSNVKRQITPEMYSESRGTMQNSTIFKKVSFGRQPKDIDFEGSVSSTEKICKHHALDKMKVHESGYLNKNEFDRESVSEASHSTWIQRAHSITQGCFERRFPAAKEVDRSPGEWTYENQNLRSVQNETNEDDKTRNVIRISSARSSAQTSSSESNSVASKSLCASDEDCPGIVYSSPTYFTENFIERKQLYQSRAGTSQDSESSMSQDQSESCVIDKFAGDYSSQELSETSSNQTDSNIIGYTNDKNNTKLQPIYEKAFDKDSLRYSTSNTETPPTSHTQMGDTQRPNTTISEGRYHQNSNSDEILKFSQKKETHFHKRAISFRSDLTDEYHSGGSLTFAVAESDTTAATNLLSTDRTVLNMSQSSAFRRVQEHTIGNQFSEQPINIGQNKPAFPTNQPMVTNASAKQTASYYQPNEWYDHHDQETQQQQSQSQRHGEAQHNRSRFTCSGGGDIKFAQHSRRGSPDSSHPSSMTCRKETAGSEAKPGEWLFIASFFVFQLFIHWMYAA